MAIIGIDLGTTNSLAAVFRDGRIQLIPNAFGEYLTPSVVSIADNGEVFVGRIAKEMLITNPAHTFCEFKRNMGTNFTYGAAGRQFRAEELSAFVLRRLKEDAEIFLGEPVTEAVISVPAYFNDDKRCATKQAGKLAGLNVERLVNEPSAVALKHHYEKEGIENFIIFDFGGGTLDVSLVEAYDNVVEIRAVSGDNYLGGKDFNDVITENFYKESGIEKSLLTGEEKGMIRKEAELLKIALTGQNKAERSIEIHGNEFTMQMTNQKLIHISVELFKRMAKPVESVLNDSDTTWGEIDQIILVGGSSKMPVVKQYIKSITDVPVILDDRPDESIAMGVGMAAAIKERQGEIKDVILADICPFSLGTEIQGGIFSPIIERNDSLPCGKTKRYVTVNDFQEILEIPIYQGENMMAKDNLLLGTMEIKVPRALKGMTGADVTFLYDINGILDVSIKGDIQSAHKVIFNKNMGLTEEDVENRVKELQEMTMHPEEQEQNRLLLEQAKRLYIENNGFVREKLSMLIRHFQETLKYGRDREIRQEYVKLSLYLNMLENNKKKNSFEAFDESFWEEDDGEDEE